MTIPPEMKPVLLLIFLCLVLGEMFVLMALAFGSGVALARRAPQTVEQYLLDPFSAAVDCVTVHMRRINVTINENAPATTKAQSTRDTE